MANHSWPVLVESLKRILANAPNGTALPPVAPQDHGKAVQWFIRIVEKPSDEEREHTKFTKNGDPYSVWPYADRVTRLLCKFITLSQNYQEYIVAAQEDGIHWRGEDFDMFQRIVEEKEKMREMGINEYRIQARRAEATIDLSFPK